MKKYNTVLSPIYENVAYLNLEHRFSEEENGRELYQHCKDRDSNLAFQAYVERRQNKAARRRHSDHFPKGRHLCSHIGRKGHKKNETGIDELPFQACIETNSHKHEDGQRKSSCQNYTRRNCSDVIRTHTKKTRDQTVETSKENFQLKEFSSDNQPADQRFKEDDTDTEYDLLEGRTSFNKRPLKHTTSDPTCNRTKIRANARDYVGYKAIENFLKESYFGSELDVKSKTVRSNSEPIASACMSERLKSSLFINAFDDKSKSLENLNVNNTNETSMKAMDVESPGSSKILMLDFKPIEAYKEDKDSYKNKAVNSSHLQQDDQIPTTSKGLSQSSIYQV